MCTLLLAIIYAAFIGLGLPDALLGSAWPVMQNDLSVDLSYAGIISGIIALGTILSSLLSHRITSRFGAGLVTGISTLATAMAMFGFALSDSFLLICLCAVPFGLGAGAVDAALNNYVALHYSPRHMSWLHCFWGVGAILGPYIMGHMLATDLGWSGGYTAVGIVQGILAVGLLCSLPLWKSDISPDTPTPTTSPHLTISQILKIRGVKLTLITFMAYIGVESSIGVWSASFMTEHRQLPPEQAAELSALFFGGITLGRFLSGFVAGKFTDKTMIRAGLMTIALGVILLALPTSSPLFTAVGLCIMGLGCAPIYPCIIHATPYRFGRENSQAVIGMQMAGAYMGSFLIPPFFGVLADIFYIGLLPAFLGLLLLAMILCSERLNRTLGQK